MNNSPTYGTYHEQKKGVRSAVNTNMQNQQNISLRGNGKIHDSSRKK